jgi:hypothetical protein
VAEVVHVYSRQEVDSGARVKGVQMPPLRSALQGQGYSDNEIVDGSGAIVRTCVFRHNQASGIEHEFMKPILVDKGLAVSENNVVEIRIDKGVGTIVKVRYRSMQEGMCEYRLDDRNVVGKTLDIMNRIGGPASSSLYCPALVDEGWQPKPFGPYDAKGWFKAF